MGKHASNIVISKITENQSEAVFDLICHAFANGSELHKALGITAQEYREFLRPSFDSMLTESLSLVAFNQNNEQIYGCLVACDFYGHDSITKPIPRRFKAISALLLQLENDYRQIRQFTKGQCMLVDLVVVDPVARGSGVYFKMRETAHGMAKSKGFETVIGELSSAATQHVCVNKLGHTVMTEIEFSKFVFENEYPFAGINNPPSIQLVEHQLS